MSNFQRQTKSRTEENRNQYATYEIVFLILSVTMDFFCSVAGPSVGRESTKLPRDAIISLSLSFVSSFLVFRCESANPVLWFTTKSIDVSRSLTQPPTTNHEKGKKGKKEILCLNLSRLALSFIFLASLAESPPLPSP
jgi:hypothetical protein